MAEVTGVDGMPVVVADLHSALPAVLAGLLGARPAIRVAYVMTDGGALPLWLSRTVAALRPHLAGTVTAGQAFGGDLEAVTLHEALLAARHVLDAEVCVVTQGPGNLGVGTPWGFSGVAAGDAVTRSPPSAAARSRACASPTPTRASGIAASATTAARRTAGSRSPARASWCLTCRSRWRPT
jgi:hypothetical protein